MLIVDFEQVAFCWTWEAVVSDYLFLIIYGKNIALLGQENLPEYNLY